MFVFMFQPNYASKCWFTLKCLFHDASLTKVEQQLRELAWLWDNNKNCSLSYEEQTLFKGQELIQCLTWSNRARKNQLDAILKLGNFSKS